MPVRYPCQDPAGLPDELGGALERWATRSAARVFGRCYQACEDLRRTVADPADLRLVGGYARMDVPVVVELEVVVMPGQQRYRVRYG